MTRFFARRRHYSALWYALHFSVLRPARNDAWGPQVGIGLLIVWLGIDIGRAGMPHRIMVTWPRRREPLLYVRWAGRDDCRRWGMWAGDLWLWRVSVRAMSPRGALASLWRLCTHGGA